MNSKTIFTLRNEAKTLAGNPKLNKLSEALTIARQLYSADSKDEWIQKALAYTLIDLCKYYIVDKNVALSSVYFRELMTIRFNQEDEIIENQKNFLRPKIDRNYSEIQKAEELSKIGKHQEALGIFRNLISENRLTELHHESYGWIIYRRIKSDADNLSSIEVRTFLRDYLNLKNKRPSILHSTILNFALSYSKTHADFKFYNFFLLWNPDSFRDDDLHDGNKDGKSIPSLISRVCKDFVNTNIVFDIEEILLTKITLSKETVLDFFREPFFWNLFHAHKDNKFTDLWNLFEYYNPNYSKYGQSKWHSEILNLAERFMKETEEWRFLSFFKNWNPGSFRDQDWKKTKKDEYTYKPLAVKSIKKAYDTLKKRTSEHDLSWLIQPYDKAIKLFPNDEWLLREKALIHIKNNELELAIRIYKQLVLELADKHYVWLEFSDCIASDNILKIGMLAKALSLEKNEDFLGDAHLDLAKTLIDESLFDNSLVELEAYKKHRELKGWKLSSVFEELLKKASSVKQSLKDNQELYKKYIPLAETFAYVDIQWTEVVLADKWKDENGKEGLTFTNGKTMQFSIRKKRFEILKQAELGQVFKFKLHELEIKKEAAEHFSPLGRSAILEHKYAPLIAERSEKRDWDILDDAFAVVDYFNKDKNIIHAITSDDREVFFTQLKDELQIGDFIAAKCYIKTAKGENRIELRQIQKVDKDAAISKFHTQIGVVDGVNEQKQLFHFVISSKLQGIVKYSETNLRPSEGDFIKVSFATKTDREKKWRVKILKIEVTEEVSQNLRKDITGTLQIKFKDNNYDDYPDYGEEEVQDYPHVPDGKLKPNTPIIPNFAFIGDYYVPKYLLERHNITADCKVNARIIFAGDKWKVTKVQKI